MAIFNTPTESTPLDRSPKKLGTGDYVGSPYSCAKFGANPSTKFDWGHPLPGAPNAGGVGQNRRLSTNNRLYLENGTI